MFFPCFQVEVRALETELEHLRNLKHKHIITYYGSEKQAEVFCIFIELMPGVCSCKG